MAMITNLLKRFSYVESEKMDILNLVTLFANISTGIRWLQGKGLLCTRKLCSLCNIPCNTIEDNGSDGIIFRCTRCKRKYSIRSDSFFAGSRLPLLTIMMIILFFCNKCGVKETVNFLNGRVSKKTVIDWFNFCREVCSSKLLRLNLKFGGPGKVVEIDETHL